MIINKHLLLLSFFLVLFLSPVRLMYVYGAEVDGGTGYSTSGNKGVQHESLKKSAINMMEAILNITNSNSNTNPDINNGQANQPDSEVSVTPYTNEQYTPIEYDGTKAQYAEKVTSIIHTNCNSGVVSSSNRSCLNNLKGTMIQSEIDRLDISAATYGHVQCIACAQVMVSASGGNYHEYGHAKDHIGKKVKGYEYISTKSINDLYKVIPGSLFVKNTGTYGHAGFVSEVIRDDNNRPVAFRAFECNLQKLGYVSHERVIPINSVTGFQVPI